ncbi:hypothetical protein VCHENC02_0331B, partial [Vibrio harveyi]
MARQRQMPLIQELPAKCIPAW